MLAGHQLERASWLADVNLPGRYILLFQENRPQFDYRARFEADCGIDAIGAAASSTRHDEAGLACWALPMADHESRHDVPWLSVDDWRWFWVHGMYGVAACTDLVAEWKA